MEVGCAESVRGDPEDGGVCSELGDGEGNSVDGEGAFVEAKGVDFGREGDFEPVILPEGRNIEDFGSGIDVALHEVTAEAVTDCESALEVDEAALGELAERGDFQCLCQDVETDGFAQAGDGEAAAVDGYRVAHGEFGCEGYREFQAGLISIIGEGDDRACGFDESGEHLIGLSSGWQLTPPALWWVRVPWDL